MWRVVRIFLTIAVISAAAAWLAETSGEVIITWLGYRIETHFGVAIAIVIFIVTLAFGVYRFLRPVIGMPPTLRRRWRERRTRHGYDALSKGMLALAAGDTQTARRMSQRTQRLLPGQPLTLLLSAQVAQLEGDSRAAERYFTAMLDSPDTEFLGLRGLFIQASRKADTPSALTYAAQAFELDPKSRWAFDALFSQQTRLKQWAAARRSVDAALRGRLMDREHARRARAVLLTAESRERAAALPREPNEEWNRAETEARGLALEAVALQPGFTPAALTAAHLLSRAGKRRRAARLLENAWRVNPHPDLARAYGSLKREDRTANGVDMSPLIRKNPEHAESKLLRAEAAIRSRDWTVALDALGPLVDPFPTARACALMAEIEQRRNGDEIAARAWLARGLRAARDPEWHCSACGTVNAAWNPNCEQCNAFDSLVWRAPISAVLVPEETPTKPKPAAPEPGGGPAVEEPHEGAATLGANQNESEPGNGNGNSKKAMQAPLRGPSL